MLKLYYLQPIVNNAFEWLREQVQDAFKHKTNNW